MFSQILLLLFVFLSLFSGILAQNRIVNGVDATESEFKFVVSLQRNGSHFCGGTILNERHILTAAHCVCNEEWDVLSLLKVKITPLKLNDPNATLISITDVICNDYDILELIKDIAILNLAEEIPTPLFEPIKLPESNFSTALPLHGVVIGWGLTSSTGSISNVLKKTDVVVYNDGLCSQSYAGTRNIEHQICYGWPLNGTGTCQGDSGGPLLVAGVQVGVISFGDDSDCSISDAKSPKVSARISTYLDWITTVLNSTTEQESSTEENVITDASRDVFKIEVNQKVTEKMPRNSSGFNRSINVIFVYIIMFGVEYYILESLNFV